MARLSKPLPMRMGCILITVMDFEISPTDLQQILASHSTPADTQNFVLLDVREPWEFEAASIAGSTLMPMGEIRSRLQELDPEAHIVTVCHHGVRSLNVALWLRQQDFENVQSLRGGIDAWSAQIDSAVPRY
ncbi:rhodanese domain protein [Silvibacterium dinghuense]|nr:rhodanese domain protein [Silvibacterium dinghuense]